MIPIIVAIIKMAIQKFGDSIFMVFSFQRSRGTAPFFNEFL